MGPAGHVLAPSSHAARRPPSCPSTLTLDRSRLARLMDRELATFAADNPRSLALHERAKGSLLDGVPMNWMVKWAGGFPLFVDTAGGAHFVDVDGHDYIDFCLGDTGAMAGHSPAADRRRGRAPARGAGSR